MPNVEEQTASTGSGRRHVESDMVAKGQLYDHPPTIGNLHGETLRAAAWQLPSLSAISSDRPTDWSNPQCLQKVAISYHEPAAGRTHSTAPDRQASSPPSPLFKEKDINNRRWKPAARKLGEGNSPSLPPERHDALFYEASASSYWEKL